MNWEAIGAIGELLGSVIVIASVIYLARQLKQTNDISRFSTAKELLTSFNEFNSHLVGNENLRLALTKTEALSASEEEQVYAYTNSMINVWLSVQEARNAGQIDEVLYLAMIRDVDIAINRWPKVLSNVELWLLRYPEVGEYQVFDAVRRARSTDA